MCVIIRPPHPWSGGSQGPETLLAPSTDKQTGDHDTGENVSRTRELKPLQEWRALRSANGYPTNIVRELYNAHGGGA